MYLSGKEPIECPLELDGTKLFSSNSRRPIRCVTAALASLRRPVYVTLVPWFLTKLLPKPFGSEVKQCCPLR